ncbi:hypothetical protein F4805DRAFT_285637 [Annulohypoxylon moriforme]|nr:hypothetical protein F4805DRAFT_285637 [Annulohypoxylon moriforme]
MQCSRVVYVLYNGIVELSHLILFFQLTYFHLSTPSHSASSLLILFSLVFYRFNLIFLCLPSIKSQGLPTK